MAKKTRFTAQDWPEGQIDQQDKISIKEQEVNRLTRRSRRDVYLPIKKKTGLSLSYLIVGSMGHHRRWFLWQNKHIWLPGMPCWLHGNFEGQKRPQALTLASLLSQIPFFLLNHHLVSFVPLNKSVSPPQRVTANWVCCFPFFPQLVSLLCRKKKRERWKHFAVLAGPRLGRAQDNENKKWWPLRVPPFFSSFFI